MKGTGWTPDEILQGVDDGRFFLFTHPEGCVVAEFIVSWRHKAMHVFVGGGSLHALDALVPEVEAFGRLNGCDIGGVTGRKGWIRYLKKFGYRPADPAVTKEL